MIQQTAPLVVTALLQSVYAGAIVYAALRIILAATHSIPAKIKYHLCNILLVIPFVAFVQPFTNIGSVLFAAPILPSEPITVVNNIVATPYTPGQVAVATTPGASFSYTELWAQINKTILAYSNIIMLVYITGLLFFTARLLLQFLQSRRMKTTGTLPASPMWLRQLDSTRRRLDVDANINIAFTTRNISPCIIGHAKALILIPVSIANNLSTEQAEAILLHELAHYKQYDYYINIATQCINCVLFFNPFAWLIAKQAANQRELACDNIAVHHGRNIELAETLALIAGMRIKENTLSLSAAKKGKLLQRVQTLLKVEPKRTSSRVLPITLVSMMAALLLVVTVNKQSYSTEKDNLREELQQISAQMYYEGNYRYVFVDAVLDSLVKLPFKGEVLYAGDQYLDINISNGYKPITKTQQEAYKKKMQNFLAMQGVDADLSLKFSTLPDNAVITLQDVRSSSSIFRNITAADKYKSGMTFNAWAVIFKIMQEDGLVNSKMRDFTMTYSISGIVINNKKLTGEADNKYRRLFKEELGIDVDQVWSTMHINDMSKYIVMEDEMPKSKHGFTIHTDSIAEFHEGIVTSSRKTLQEMHKEGLIDTNYKVVIAYLDGEVYANYIHLKGAQAEKYLNMLLPANKSRKEAKSTLSIYQTEHLDRPFPPSLKKSSMDLAAMKKIEQLMAETNNNKTQHDEAMKRHKEAISLHDKAMIAHDKAMAKHEKTFEQLKKNTAKLEEEQDEHKSATSLSDKLIEELAIDKLVNKGSYILVERKPDGLYVNAKKLESKFAAKYEKMTAEYGYGYAYGRVFERVPEGVAVPDRRSSNSVIHIPANGTNLQGIADQMFTQGNSNFILALAMKDGLLRQRQNYNFIYKDGKVYWDKHLLGEPLQSKYAGLCKSFIKAHGNTTTSFSMRGDGVTKKELGDPESTVRSKRINAGRNAEGEYYVNTVIRMMAKDGVLDTTQWHMMKYNARGIFVNGKKLDDEIAARYEPVLEKGYGHKPRAIRGDQVSYINQP